MMDRRTFLKSILQNQLQLTEEYFTPRPNPEKEIPVDELLCSLAQAGAIITLLMHDSDIKSDNTTLNAMWCARGILDQMKIIVEHSAGIEEVVS